MSKLQNIREDNTLFNEIAQLIEINWELKQRKDFHFYII